MSIFDHNQHVISSKDIEVFHHLSGEYLRCYLCGLNFRSGDSIRLIDADSLSLVSPFVCAACDGPEILEKWHQTVSQFNSRRFDVLKQHLLNKKS